MPELDDLTHVLLTLERAKRRATYGAVAGHLGATPRFLMNGRPRDPLHSWVVSKATGHPTGYAEANSHADLFAHDRVIETPGELATLLGEP